MRVITISNERLLAFSRTLAESVRSGLPLAKTLRAIARSVGSGRELATAADMVGQGKALHESLGAQQIFPSLFIALIRAGEEAGKIEKFLDRFSESVEVKIEFQRKIKRTLFYPAVVTVIVGALFIFFSARIIPILVQPIVNAGVPLSGATLAIIAIGQWLLTHWLLLLVSAFGANLAFSLFWSSRPGCIALALAGHWLPGVRFACEEVRFYTVASSFELLLRAGLRPGAAIDILLDVFRDDPVTRYRLSHAAQMVSEGKTFSESVGVCMPSEDRPRLKIAEQAGRLDEAFGEIAKMHRDWYLHRLKFTASAIQISATIAMVPACFGLIFCLLWPTLSLFGAAEKLLSGAGSSAPNHYSVTPPPTPESTITVEEAAAALFNESKAKEIVNFMQASPLRTAETVATHLAPSRPPTLQKRPKPLTPMPKLKPGPAFRKPSINKIEPTAVQSALP